MTDTASLIEQYKIIAILRNLNFKKLQKTVKALTLGGVFVIEITYDGNNRISDKKTALYIKRTARKFKNVLFGAGTVVNENQVLLSYKAGAKFIVSPHTDEKIISLSKKLGLTSVAGAITPTEIMNALSNNCDFIKLFPAECSDKGLIKSLSAPFNNAKFIPYGGITCDNISAYLNSGAVAVGVSSFLVSPCDIKNNDYGKITEKAQALISKL